MQIHSAQKKQQSLILAHLKQQSLILAHLKQQSLILAHLWTHDPSTLAHLSSLSLSSRAGPLNKACLTSVRAFIACTLPTSDSTSGAVDSIAGAAPGASGALKLGTGGRTSGELRTGLAATHSQKSELVHLLYKRGGLLRICSGVVWEGTHDEGHVACPRRARCRCRRA